MSRGNGITDFQAHWCFLCIYVYISIHVCLSLPLPTHMQTYRATQSVEDNQPDYLHHKSLLDDV